MRESIVFRAKLGFKTEIFADKAEKYLDGGAFYVIDDYFSGVFDSLPSQKVFWFTATEENKSLHTAQQILSAMADVNLSRGDTLVAIGGGITLDVAAFCASIHKRGCGLMLVPTTIIAMIDAAIGGKTAVNSGAKNQIGTFYPAQKVILDFSFLESLPEKEIKNGFAELIKMMIISHREFFSLDFEYITENQHKFLWIAIESKVQICAEDLADKGQRQMLNLGHTFGHLFEVVSDYAISHGDAVAMGLVWALRLSLSQDLISAETHNSMLRYIKHFCNLPTLTAKQKERIDKEGMQILFKDKKAAKEVRFVLVSEAGVEIKDKRLPQKKT